MDDVECRYVGGTHPQVGAQIVFDLERKDSPGQFRVFLSADDATKLRDDLDVMLLASAQPED